MRTLCFGGSLREIPVPIVLHRIVQSKAKGTLTLSSPAERIHLFFVDGELKAANSTRAGMRVGDTLLVHGVVPEENFEEAIHSLKSGRSGRIGKLLVEKGLLTREVLDAEIRRHFGEIFFSCFAWREGDFAFLPSYGQLDSDVSLDLPTAALIIEGVRREAEDDPGVDALGDPAHFGRATPLATELQSLRLSSEEAYFLSLCDGTTRLRDILRLGRSRSQTAPTLYTLLACGLIEFVPTSALAQPAAVRSVDHVPFLPTPDGLDESTEIDPEVRDERARDAYTEALTSLAKGNYYDATALLQECVRLLPDNVEYRFQLAGALSRNPLWHRRALVQYREALELDPFRQELLQEFAKLLLAEKKFRAAYEIAERLVAHHPNAPHNHELMARCRAAALGRADTDAEIGRLQEHGGWIPSPRFHGEPR